MITLNKPFIFTFLLLIFHLNSSSQTLESNSKHSNPTEVKLIDTTINNLNFVVYGLKTGEIKVNWGSVSGISKYEDIDLLDTISKSTKPIMVYSKNSINTKSPTNVYRIDSTEVYFTFPIQNSRIALWGVSKKKNKLIFYKDIFERVAPMIFSTPNIIINADNADIIAGSELIYEEYPDNSFSKFSNVYILTTYGTTSFNLISYYRYPTKISVFDNPLEFYKNLFKDNSIPNPLYKRKSWTGK